MGNKETKFEEILLIEAFEEKESKSGRNYFVFETDKGNFSVFEFELAKELKEHIGEKGEFECAKRDNFKNIRGIINWIEEKVGNKKPLLKTPQETNGLNEVQAAKDISIYTSYAKDLFIEIRKDEQVKNMDSKIVMQFATELIKQARDAFK